MTHRLVKSTINTRNALSAYLRADPADAGTKALWAQLLQSLPLYRGELNARLADALVRDAIACGWSAHPDRAAATRQHPFKR